MSWPSLIDLATLIFMGRFWTKYKARLGVIRSQSASIERNMEVEQVKFLVRTTIPICLLVLAISITYQIVTSHHHQKLIYAAEQGYIDGWNAACEEIFSSSPSNQTYYWQGMPQTAGDCKILLLTFQDGKDSDDVSLMAGFNPKNYGIDGAYSEGFNNGKTEAKIQQFNLTPVLCYDQNCFNNHDFVITREPSSGKNYLQYRS